MTPSQRCMKLRKRSAEIDYCELYDKTTEVTEYRRHRSELEILEAARDIQRTLNHIFCVVRAVAARLQVRQDVAGIIRYTLRKRYASVLGPAERLQAREHKARGDSGSSYNASCSSPSEFSDLLMPSGSASRAEQGAHHISLPPNTKV